jgi:hypothetical protein
VSAQLRVVWVKGRAGVIVGDEEFFDGSPNRFIPGTYVLYCGGSLGVWQIACGREYLADLCEGLGRQMTGGWFVGHRESSF